MRRFFSCLIYLRIYCYRTKYDNTTWNQLGVAAQNTRTNRLKSKVAPHHYATVIEARRRRSKYTRTGLAKKKQVRFPKLFWKHLYRKCDTRMSKTGPIDVKAAAIRKWLGTARLVHPKVRSEDHAGSRPETLGARSGRISWTTSSTCPSSLICIRRASVLGMQEGDSRD